MPSHSSEGSSQSFDPSNGIILVQAKIFGKDISNTARLVFDTGATHCMLPWWMVNELGIHIDSFKSISTTTASTVETSPLIILSAVEVLGHRVEHVSCIVRDLPPLAGVDGLLGLSFLKHFRVELDFIEGELVLYPNGQEPEDD